MNSQPLVSERDTSMYYDPVTFLHNMQISSHRYFLDLYRPTYNHSIIYGTT